MFVRPVVHLLFTKIFWRLELTKGYNSFLSLTGCRIDDGKGVLRSLCGWDQVLLNDFRWVMVERAIKSICRPFAKPFESLNLAFSNFDS